MAGLILSGGGSGEQTKEIDTKFAELIDKSKPLLYIPVAIDTNKYPYNGCLEWLKLTFDNLGIKNYEMWIEKDLEKWKDISAEKFGGIYIGGGNTPYLLKILKESGLWNWLRNATDKVPIYGGSAGAIIFSKTIIPSLSEDENDVGLKDFDAMNSIKDYEMWCHYTPEKEKVVKEFIGKYHLGKIIALPDETGLLVSGDTIEIIGKKDATLFSEGIKKIKVGEFLE